MTNTELLERLDREAQETARRYQMHHTPIGDLAKFTLEGQAADAIRALEAENEVIKAGMEWSSEWPPAEARYAPGDLLEKKSGSFWKGPVVGFYSTAQTPIGYCVQLAGVENGPVQIYPESALVPCHETPKTEKETFA